VASDRVREVQERRRSSAASPVTRDRGLGNAAAIAEQLKDLDEDDIPCGSSYCTKDGCFDAQGNPV
jgi:hypothetical protein